MSYEQLKKKPPQDFQFLRGLPSQRISPSLLKFTLQQGKRPLSPGFKLFLDIVIYDNRGNQLNKLFKVNSCQNELYKALALHMNYKENAIFLVSDQQPKPLEESGFKFYSLSLIAEEDTREYASTVQGTLQRAIDNKERGNLYYKDNQYMQANKCYKRAYNVLKQIFLRAMSVQEKEHCFQVIKASLLNLMQTAILIHETSPGQLSQNKLQQCKQKVNGFQFKDTLSKNPKFKFRYGKVLFYLGEYLNSEQTLKEALQLGVLESKDFLSKINKTQNVFYKKLFSKLPEEEAEYQ